MEHLETILEIHFQWSLSRWNDSWEKKENVELAFLTIFEINNLEVKCQILFKKKKQNNVGGKGDIYYKQARCASSREK